MNGELIYAQALLNRATVLMEQSIEAVRAANEKKQGVPLKVSAVRLIPVAGEQREVYDVVVTMVPDPERVTKPPEAIDEPSV